MKNNNNRPTDEQIAEYLSGTASESDNLLVRRYLEESNEAVDDMINIVVASVVHNRQVAKKKTRRLFLYPTRWAVAASVALVLITGGMLMLRNPAPDTTVVAGTDPKKELPIHDGDTPSGAEMGGDTDAPATNNRTDAANVTAVQREDHITASEAKADALSLDVTFPRRKHEASPAGSGITFRWQSNAASLTLTVTNGSGDKLVQTSIPGSGSYTVPAEKVADADEIRWSISAGDGACQSGTIAIVGE